MSGFGNKRQRTNDEVRTTSVQKCIKQVYNNGDDEMLFELLDRYAADKMYWSIMDEIILDICSFNTNEERGLYLLRRLDDYLDIRKYEDIPIVRLYGLERRFIREETHRSREYEKSYLLLETARVGNWKIVRYLLDHGFDVNKENDNGENVLYIVTKNKKLYQATYLVQAESAIVNDKLKEYLDDWSDHLDDCTIIFSKQ